MKITNSGEFINYNEPFVAFSSKYGIITFKEIVSIIKKIGSNDCLGDNTYMTYTYTLKVDNFNFVYQEYTYNSFGVSDEHYDDFFTINDNRITDIDRWKELFDNHTKEELFEIIKYTDYNL